MTPGTKNPVCLGEMEKLVSDELIRGIVGRAVTIDYGEPQKAIVSETPPVVPDYQPASVTIGESEVSPPYWDKAIAGEMAARIRCSLSGKLKEEDIRVGWGIFYDDRPGDPIATSCESEEAAWDLAISALSRFARSIGFPSTPKTIPELKEHGCYCRRFVIFLEPEDAKGDCR
jgi:hypothetical protein